MLAFDYENEALGKGFCFVCGVDEAGRGPLAGPVCAAAVILPAGCVIEGINDSKKLSAKKREALELVIKREAVCFAVRMVDVATIDRINILNASHLAMCEAVEALRPPADYALVDGNMLPRGLKIPGVGIVGGDGISPSVAAASILAKVERDRFMAAQAAVYPGYSFEQHKGYGTQAHIRALHALGPCGLHRRSFLRKIL